MKTKKSLTVKMDHLNIRQSIAIVLVKLVLLEIIASSGFLFVYFGLSQSLVRESISGLFDSYFGWVFLLLVVVKILVTIYVILDWLNSYYEIDKENIYTRKGIIWMTEQKFAIANLGDVVLEQGIIGRLLNFGNIRIFDTELKRDFLLYLIHNPQRYFAILEELAPQGDKEKKIVRQKLSSEIDL